MNKINRFCLLSIVLVTSSLVCAQQATTPLERKILEKALDNFEMYKSCITIADDETKSYFLDLFKDKSVPVYNDLLGITSKNDLNVSDYLNEQKANMAAPIIKICNVNRDRIWEEDGKWKVQLSFDKSLSFQNQCGINFNTLDFYGSMFRETMILTYDDSNQECRIESISGKIDSNKRLPDDYCILDSTNVKDNKVVYKHPDGFREQVRFNSFGQMLLTFGHENKQFSYVDNDVSVKTDYRPECHLMTLSYKTHHWRIKPHYDVGLGKPLSVSNEYIYRSVSSKASSFGVDVGYVFPSKSRFKMGVFMGFGFSTSSLNLSDTYDLYSFTTNQDIDGDNYTRYYENLSLNQKSKIREFSIPVYADFDWRFNRWVSLYINAGIQLNLNMSYTVDDFSGSASDVYGIYSIYNNLRLDHNWGYNGFTRNLTLTQENLCESESVIVKKFAPDILAAVGLRINIPRTPLAMDLGIGYQKGIGDILSVSDDVNADKNNGKMIYNQIEGQNNIEHIHDLVENVEKVSRNLLKFNIGLIFKF